VPVSLPTGKLQFCKPASELPQLAQGQLLELVVDLLKEERDAALAAGMNKPLEYDPSQEGKVQNDFSYAFNNGWVPGTLATSLANSSNAVMRM
jgi:CCR4-NOT complex subunit CAF16